MRIGFDAKRAFQNFRGLGNYSRGLIEGLLEYSDHDVFLYAPKQDDHRTQKWLSSLSRFKNQKYQVRLPEHPVEKILPALWRSFSITDSIKKDSIDIYHGLSHEVPYGISHISGKSVVTIHDLIFMRYPEFFPYLDRVVYKKKFTYSTKNSDLVIAICEQTKKDLIELLGVDEKKIVVHYQSCDPVFYRLASFEEKKALMNKYGFERPFILTVGAFEERKNQLALIEAYSKIASSVEQDLILIGNGKKYLEQCKAKAKELGIDRRVIFLSNISFTELPLFYQTADLFCFPSHFEGFGLPIVEAMFSKTPVITSFGSCFPESAGPDSLYVNPLDVDDIAQKMEMVLSNVGLQEAMIEKGYQYVQKFHRKNSTEALLAIYQSLL